MNLSPQKACVIFNKLIINAIEDSSGIFVGSNQAIAWSSYSKQNHGFGSLRDSVLTNSVNVVYDPDLMDLSIMDVKTVSEAGSVPQQSAVEFSSINVVSFNNGSVLGVGGNKQNTWSNSRKNNYGNGKVYGSNRIQQVANVVLDNDVIDTKTHAEGHINQYPNAEGSVKDIRITSGTDRP